MSEQPDSVLSIREQMIVDETQQIMEALNDPAENRLNAIPESHFKEIFLPMFMGVNKQDPRGINYSTWIHLTGGAYREMAIVDDRNLNNILFVVPPLFVYSDFDYLRKVRGDEESTNIPSIGLMAYHAEQLGFSRPAEAQAFVINVMQRYRNSRINLHDLINYLSRWAEIAKRYDFKLTDVAFLKDIADVLEQQPVAVQESTPSDTRLDDDDFEEA